MPAGLTLDKAWAENVGIDAQASYADSTGHDVVSTYVAKHQLRPIKVDVWTDNGTPVFRTATIDGLPAVTWETPANDSRIRGVRAFDAATGIEYLVQVTNGRALTLGQATEIWRSMHNAAK